MSDLAAIRERHRPGVPRSSGNVYCQTDGQPWGEKGCDTAQVLAALVGLREAMGQIVGAPHFAAAYEIARAALADTGSATDE